MRELDYSRKAKRYKQMLTYFEQSISSRSTNYEESFENTFKKSESFKKEDPSFWLEWRKWRGSMRIHRIMRTLAFYLTEYLATILEYLKLPLGYVVDSGSGNRLFCLWINFVQFWLLNNAWKCNFSNQRTCVRQAGTLWHVVWELICREWRWCRKPWILCACTPVVPGTKQVREINQERWPCSRNYFSLVCLHLHRLYPVPSICLSTVISELCYVNYR